MHNNNTTNQLMHVYCEYSWYLASTETVQEGWSWVPEE